MAKKLAFIEDSGSQGLDLGVQGFKVPRAFFECTLLDVDRFHPPPGAQDPAHCHLHGGGQRAALRGARGALPPLALRDFKDAVYPFFESDTLLLECSASRCC